MYAKPKRCVSKEIGSFEEEEWSNRRAEEEASKRFARRRPTNERARPLSTLQKTTGRVPNRAARSKTK